MENLHAKSPTDDSLVTTSITSLGVFLLLMLKQAPITSGISGFGCYGALALQWVIPLIWQIIQMDRSQNPFNGQPLENCGHQGSCLRGAGGLSLRHKAQYTSHGFENDAGFKAPTIT